MDKKTIAIVGCGNVGSRHLQAIAKLPVPASVDIVEPTESARQTAESRLAEVPNRVDLNWHRSIHDLKRKSDLTIVATSSVGRSGIISQLLESGHSRFLIEKMVCQSAKEYEELLAKTKAHDAKGWVNTPRRYYKSYQEIRECLRASGPIHMSVAAGNIGLGSNAIHFLDLFSWFCDDNEIRLKEALYDRLFPNKRGPDLVEFAGTITGLSQDSTLEVSFHPANEDVSLIVSITAKGVHLTINESKEEFSAEPNDCLDNLKFQNEYVSDTTTRIAGDIFTKDDCSLPTLQDSYYSHCELFRIFNAHIKKLTNQEKELCPIT